MSEKRNHKIYNPKMECMSRDERAALQSERLRELVRREYDHVEVYRRRMDEKGVRPEDIRTIEDIRLLPFMEKTDLRDQWPFGLFAVPKRDSAHSGLLGHHRTSHRFGLHPARSGRLVGDDGAHAVGRGRGPG